MILLQIHFMNSSSSDSTVKSSYILGISCFYHDAGVCLLKDGQIIAAAEEERFTRKKHDSSFPKNAISFCLSYAGIAAHDLEAVGFYDKPLLKFERILLSYLQTWPRGAYAFAKALPVWFHEKLFIPQLIKRELGYEGPLYFAPHHMSHAASSFLVSPYREAAILTVDGVGESATTTYGVGKDNNITLLKEIHFPDSLGLMYSAFTYYLGFKVNSAEYKVMGAAPYGQPLYVQTIKDHLIDIKDDGSFRLNMDYFAYQYGLCMISKKFEILFGGQARDSDTQKMEQRHWDIAASLQKVTEEVMLKAAMHLHRETNLTNLCMAGGVALNCVANGRILRETPFKNIFIQPAAGDAGGAVGIAFYIWNTIKGNPRAFEWQHAYWGQQFSDVYIKTFLEKLGVRYTQLPREELLKTAAKLIVDQGVVGWFQGRTEFGPRALGNRSILADARNRENWQRVNLKIKFRESFRPFAPTVLEEKCSEYFDLQVPSPYMLLVASVLKDTIPAVTHVDKSARIQTVSRQQNELYYDLIKEFKNVTGYPVIINTSFNVRGEPIVNSPEHAFTCFMRTEMDYLVMGPFLLSKKDMPPLTTDSDWMKEFELD